jgi:hypothetical protein
MKYIYMFLVTFFVSSATAQTTFWTENFGVGCNQNQLANGIPASPGPGNWYVTYLSPYVPSTGSDEFYISATEAGMGPGNCGNGCLLTGGTNQTLHIGNSACTAPTVCTTGDCGAFYKASLFSDLRAESQSINCLGRNTIT